MRSDAQIIQRRPVVDRWRIDLLPVVTFTLWLACLIVGLVGHYVRLAPPAEPVPPQTPTQATLVNVSLSKSLATAAPLDPAPVADTPPIPDAPPLPQVVEITPAIAFAVPVEGPVRVMPKALSPAPPKLSLAQPKPAGPTYKQITYGTGEGAQPQPDYPVEAYTAGQTGTVMVRYRVAEDGTVTSTEVTQPCPWPLLNQAAARSIRETWSYPPGPVRYFEIKITYRNKSE